MALDLTNFAERAEKAGMGIPTFWKEPVVGQIQFDFLLSKGLKPHHKLVDIGSGTFRAGVHFIDYLEDDCYFAIEKIGGFVNGGMKVVRFFGLDRRKFSYQKRGDFKFSVFNTEFDYALANSVFTHLELFEIFDCLRKLKEVLKPDGVFYTTFFKWEKNSPKIGKGLKRYPFETMVYIAKLAGFSVKFIGQFGHPNGRQLMLEYRHAT